MGPSDMAQTVAVFHEQGDQPWAECTEQPFKNTAPQPSLHACTPATGSELLANLYPSICRHSTERLEDRNYFLCFPKIVDRVHSLEMSAESPVLAERLEVMATVKKGCLHDSHLYRKCYMERRKQGGREGVLKSIRDTEMKNYPTPTSIITWECSL